MNGFEVHFLAQGRVDAILLGCGDEWAFVDAGYRKNGQASIEYMKKLGIKKLKYYIASHGHKNHIGGAAPIIEAFAPDAVYVPREKVVEAVKKYASGAKEKEAVAQANYVVLKRGDAFTLGEAVFTCIGPLKFKSCSCGAYAENYNSGILRGVYKGRSILLTGDTSDAKLSNIHEDTPGAIKAEVYKNHHHNGRTGLAVLKKISPQIVVVCNSGAPSSSYQKTIKEVGAKLYTAAKKCEGDVVLYTRGTKWEYGLPPQEAEGESGEEGETGMATKASAERVIAQAQKWVGYVEKKSNKNLDDFTANAGKNNYTRFNRDYVSVMKGHSYPGSINMQWCAAFVSCMFMYEFGVDAARELLCGDLHCYTPAGAKYFKNKGRYTKRKNADPQPGDVVFFYSSSKGRIGHVGIVTKVDSSKVYTIEGNTSGGSKLVTNGGAVWNKSYKKTSTYIDGYGRPDYAGVMVPETPPDNWVKEYQLGDRTLEKNMTGADVKELQSMLIALGYDLGDWGADGDFGSDTQSAVKQFQKDYHLVVDGIAGPDTLEALLEASSRNDPESGEAEGPVEEEEPDGTLAEVGDIDEKEEPLEGDGRVVLVSSGNTVNVRDQPNTEGKILGVARRGESFPYRGETSEAGWHSIAFQDAAGWISGKYTTLTGEKLDPETPPQSTKEYAVDALDLSSWNSAQAGKIDWASIRDNVGFLILRAGITRLETKPLGIGPDEYFKKWAGKCNELGIPFWAYYYSQGKTAEKAREEAEYLYNIASPFNPVGYVLDCEEKNIKVAAFFARLYELGAKKTMLYIGHNWYKVYDLPVDEQGFIQCCDAVWIPRYGKNDGTAKDKYIPAYPCDLWQYSSVFSFSGIPDKTLDVNKITGQRRSLLWFRGEE